MIPADEIKIHVREHYRGWASQSACCSETSCCGSQGARSCCDTTTEWPAEFIGPSLSCGSPLTYAQVQPGETVVDLGSGAGGDVLLAARQVGPVGRVIGVDMTPEMIWKARTNAERAGLHNAEFRLGEIERLPLPDESADVSISNCVINLVPDKALAFREAYRVLRPGGRLVISDMVSRGPLPDEIRADPGAWAGCVGGALDVNDYLATIEAAGFREVEIVSSGSAPPGRVFSATVRARKPA